ncbi:MAG: type II toxin-antitoxin system RelE/ParE family toxin [Saprospiraceae bacterium]
MKLKVVWSPDAREEYDEILQYLVSEYGMNPALKMLDKIESILGHITAYPRAFPFSPLRPDIRKAVVSLQTSLLYRVTDTEIQLLHFWDNRQDPKKMELM